MEIIFNRDMKQNLLAFIVLFIVLTISFPSCNGKDDNVTLNNPDDLLEDPINNPDEYKSEEYNLDEFIEDIINSPDKVRLLKVFRYSNSTVSKHSGEVVYEYDEAGNLIKESSYDCRSTGNLIWMQKEYEYSENRKIKEKIFDGEVGNVTLGSYVVYIYSGDLLEKKETYCGRGCYGSLIHSTNYEYDERGNLVRIYSVNSDNGIYGDIKYVYDNQNRLILEENTETEVSDYYHKYLKYIYDNDGRETKQEYYSVNNKLILYVQKVYDETSQLPSMDLHYDINGNLTAKYQHFYDEWGNLTETINSRGCSYFKRKYVGDFLIEDIDYGTWDTGFNDCSESGVSRYKYQKF